MKQHITIEQLQELTPEQQTKLRDWWEPEGKGLCVDMVNPRNGPIQEHFVRLGEHKFHWLPLLSIGQCIELLEYKGLKGIMPVIDCDVITKVEGWDVEVNNCYFKGKELIDALWEAVKEVL